MQFFDNLSPSYKFDSYMSKLEKPCASFSHIRTASVEEVLPRKHEERGGSEDCGVFRQQNHCHANVSSLQSV